MKLYKYRLWCDSDSKWVYWWLTETDPVPTKCSENSIHNMDLTRTTIIEQLDEPQVSNTGALIVSPTYETSTDVPCWHKWKFIAQAGQTTFFDIQLTNEKSLKGGKYYIVNYSDINSELDYLECSLIDKNNVMGLFNNYGLVVGQDVLELGKFVITEYVEPTDKFIASYGVMPLSSGLFLRLAYNSFGSVDIRLRVRFEFQK